MVKQTFDQFPEKLWVTTVQVATVWTNPESSREMDAPGTTNPTNIDKWIETLTHETRLALCDENRVQTQLLYGEAVIITEVKGEWAQVVIPTQASKKDKRGYPGWVPLNQLKEVSKKDWRRAKTAAIIDDKAWLETKDGEQVLKLSYMTLLPVELVHDNRVEVVTPHGRRFLPKSAVSVFASSEGLQKRDGKAIAQIGKRYVGLDYFWGGMSSFGYDCSGFSYNMSKACGYQIPRDAGDQAAAGQMVPFDQLLPGDLIFFAYKEGKGDLHHVGIYQGDGKMIHSPSTGKGIEITELKDTIYEKELCAASRYWQEAGE